MSVYVYIMYICTLYICIYVYTHIYVYIYVYLYVYVCLLTAKNMYFGLCIYYTEATLHGLFGVWESWLFAVQPEPFKDY